MRETYKRLLCLITAIAVISGLFPAYAADILGNGVSAPPVYHTDTLIEFEDGYYKTALYKSAPAERRAAESAQLCRPADGLTIRQQPYAGYFV